MSLLSYTNLLGLVEEGVIDAPVENINGASIDITLGDKILVEVDHDNAYGMVDLASKETPHMKEIDISSGSYHLQPGEFVLATSNETFNLPNDVACEYKLKSSLARSGLQHMLAGWCDPGWNNSKLTLELKNVLNHNMLVLRPGMKIGQMVFFECEPVPEGQDYSAKGQYNNQESVTASKGVR